MITSILMHRGYIRKDYFGRIVIDTCKSDEDHLRNSKAKPGYQRAGCRVLVEDNFNEFVGMKGFMKVTIEVTRDPDEE